MPDYEITNDDIKHLAKVLRRVDPELAKRMRRTIRDAAKPVVREMRNALGTNRMNAAVTDPAPDHRPYDGPSGSRGLTGRMQRAVRIQVSGGRVRIYVASRALGDASRLPAYIDAGKPWRHPVYGNDLVWVQQSATASGWFTHTAVASFIPLKAKALEALTDTARALATQI